MKKDASSASMPGPSARDARTTSTTAMSLRASSLSAWVYRYLLGSSQPVKRSATMLGQRWRHRLYRERFGRLCSQPVKSSGFAGASHHGNR
jgi:hypothetical protein